MRGFVFTMVLVCLCTGAEGVGQGPSERVGQVLMSLAKLGRQSKVYLTDAHVPVPETLRPSVKDHGGKIYQNERYKTKFQAKELESEAQNGGDLFRLAVGPTGLASLTHLIDSEMLVESLDYVQYYLVRDKLINSTMRAKSIEDADYVLVNENCSTEFQEFLHQEEQLLKKGQLKKPLTRLVLCGCSPINWLRRRMESLEECDSKHLDAYASFTYGSFDFEFPTNIMTPYVTDIHDTAVDRLSTSDVIFHHNRQTLITFEGSITSSRKVKRSRKVFINELVEASHNMTLSMNHQFPHGLKHLFFAPYVDGLEVPTDFLHHTEKFRVLKQKGKTEHMKLDILGTYGNSHFCLNPPGDNVFRRGVWDSVQMGCIPVMYEEQVEGHIGLFDRALWSQDETGLTFRDIFWVVPEDINKTEFLTSLLTALESGEVERRRNILQTIASALVYSWDDVDDAFVIGLGALQRRFTKLAQNPPTESP